STSTTSSPISTKRLPPRPCRRPRLHEIGNASPVERERRPVPPRPGAPAKQGDEHPRIGSARLRAGDAADPVCDHRRLALAPHADWPCHGRRMAGSLPAGHRLLPARNARAHELIENVSPLPHTCQAVDLSGKVPKRAKPAVRWVRLASMHAFVRTLMMACAL